MKTLLISRKGSEFRLVADEPGLNNDKKVLLARMINDEGTLCWTLEDLRLHPLVGVSLQQYFGQCADDFEAHFIAESHDKLAAAKAELREFSEEPAGDGATLLRWCTYKGIVKGRTACDLGEQSLILSRWPVLHLKEPAMEQMLEMQKFWEKLDLDVSSPDIRVAISNVKIPNVNLQPTEAQVMFNVWMASRTVDEESSTPCVPRG